MTDQAGGSSPTTGKHVREVSRKDLPLHCPLPDAPLWSAHPRVYLPLGAVDRVRCPYCGTEYLLKE